MIIMENKEKHRPSQVTQFLAAGLDIAANAFALLMAIVTKRDPQKFRRDFQVATKGLRFPFSFRDWLASKTTLKGTNLLESTTAIAWAPSEVVGQGQKQGCGNDGGLTRSCPKFELPGNESGCMLCYKRKRECPLLMYSLSLCRFR